MTCGLRIVPDTNSANLTPQETTNQDVPDMGPDGAGLSCPGSSVVTYSEDTPNRAASMLLCHRAVPACNQGLLDLGEHMCQERSQQMEIRH